MESAGESTDYLIGCFARRLADGRGLGGRLDCGEAEFFAVADSSKSHTFILNDLSLENQFASCASTEGLSSLDEQKNAVESIHPRAGD